VYGSEPKIQREVFFFGPEDNSYTSAIKTTDLCQPEHDRRRFRANWLRRGRT